MREPLRANFGVSEHAEAWVIRLQTDNAKLSTANADLEAEVARLRTALEQIGDDVGTVLDQHVSPEVHKEARRQLIEHLAEALRSQAGETP